MKQLSARLRSIIEVRGLRQQNLAEAAEMSQGHISDLLAEKRGIGPGSLNRLLDAMGVSSRKMRHRLHRAGARDAGWEI